MGDQKVDLTSKDHGEDLSVRDPMVDLSAKDHKVDLSTKDPIVDLSAQDPMVDYKMIVLKILWIRTQDGTKVDTTTLLFDYNTKTFQKIHIRTVKNVDCVSLNLFLLKKLSVLLKLLI